MLIILSGVETIHKKFFARQILAALNTYQVDGYTVTFKDQVPTVIDAEGNIWYKPVEGDQPAINKLLVDLDNDGVYDEAGNATFDKIQELNTRIFLDGVRDNHFSIMYNSLPYDFGVTDQLEFEIPEGFQNPHSYQDILNNYNNRESENFVISGSFGKGFIDKIRSDIGAENVTAVNIVRNPSVCKVLHEKSSEYYEKNITYTKEFDDAKLSVSIVNAVSLVRANDVITLRFEDILVNGNFTLLGKVISAPAGYTPYNQWLTQWEYDEHVLLGLCTPQELDEFNTMYQHLASTLGQDPKFPENVFDMLNYEPLTYEEIVYNGTPE